MNYRINTKVVSLVVILVLVAVVLFVYTLVSAPTGKEIVTNETNTVGLHKVEKILTAKHQFQDGIHTIAGRTDVPTRCHRIIAETFFTSEDLSSVEVRFSTFMEGETCPSEFFEVPFRVSFEAPEDVALQATWNGDFARLNLIPLQPGEVLEDEMYIKG